MSMHGKNLVTIHRDKHMFMYVLTFTVLTKLTENSLEFRELEKTSAYPMIFHLCDPTKPQSHIIPGFLPL